MEPSKKSAQMEAALDNISQALFGRNRSECIEQGVCVDCGSEVKPDSFRDDTSQVEFTISGFCQACQDRIFSHDEGGEG